VEAGLAAVGVVAVVTEREQGKVQRQHCSAKFSLSTAQENI